MRNKTKEQQRILAQKMQNWLNDNPDKAKYEACAYFGMSKSYGLKMLRRLKEGYYGDPKTALISAMESLEIPATEKVTIQFYPASGDIKFNTIELGIEIPSGLEGEERELAKDRAASKAVLYREVV